MTIGIVGRKTGMTRVFTADGASIPVTVVEATPNRVTQVKTADTDGYSAVQITVGERKASRVSKPEAGHFAKAGVAAGRGLWELRLADGVDSPAVGEEITVSSFEVGQKRWNFRMQDATHGNSRSHRAPGSIGQNQSPGRVFKGKKMAGHMGDERVTVQTLEVVRVDVERNLLLIKGAIPGAPGADVIVRPAEKA